jgi:hypothetical protein
MKGMIIFYHIQTFGDRFSQDASKINFLAIKLVKHYLVKNERLQKFVTILKMLSDETTVNFWKDKYPQLEKEKDYNKLHGKLPHLFKEEKWIKPLTNPDQQNEIFCKRIHWKDVEKTF